MVDTCQRKRFRGPALPSRRARHDAHLGRKEASDEKKIPVFQGNELKIVNRSPNKFAKIEGLPTPWFSPMTLDIGDELYTIDACLSVGNEGQAYMMTRLGTGEELVAKFCSTTHCREVHTVLGLPAQLAEHEHVVKYELVVLDVSNTLSPAKHIIMMQHVPNGDVFDLIAFEDPSIGWQPLSEGTSRRVLQDLIRTVAECYRLGLAHRDLKPENLLLDAHGRVVIIDMGHAKQARGSEVPDAVDLSRLTTCHMYGTPGYRAPEVTQHMPYDCELADVWSVGVIAFMMYTKLPVFVDGVASQSDASGPDNAVLWQKVSHSGYYQQCPDKLKQFINTLWQA